MSKVKMRCIVCGKWFQSANAKEVTCPDCMQKARKEKLAAKSAPPTPSKPAGQGLSSPGSTRSVPPPPKPKPSSGGAGHWLDTLSDVKVGEPDQPARPKLPSSPAPRDNRGGQERSATRGPGGPGTYRDERDRGFGGYREGMNRGPGGYREGDRERRGPGAYKDGMSGTLGQRPRQPMEGGSGWSPRPAGATETRPDKFKKGGKPKGPPKAKISKPAAPPKPKREKIPPPKPFEPTPEQVAQVEARYQELATPTEYDGIRTQIAKELGIPKKAVKKIVKEYRDREHVPSWWELQTYKGSAEELEKIKAVYVPYLPVPPVGVHKKIAEELDMKPADVYQAIKAIRLEMNLPQYNDPSFHEEELAQLKKLRTAHQKADEAGESKEQEAPVQKVDAGESQEEKVDASSAVTAEKTAETPVEASEVPSGSDVAVGQGDNTAEVPVEVTEVPAAAGMGESVPSTATEVSTITEE